MVFYHYTPLNTVSLGFVIVTLSEDVFVETDGFFQITVDLFRELFAMVVQLFLDVEFDNLFVSCQIVVQ